MKSEHEKQIDLIRVHAANWLKNSEAGALHYAISESEYKNLAWICIIHGILHGPVAPPPEVMADDESCLSYLASVLGVQKTDLHLLYALYLRTCLMHPECFAEIERNAVARSSADNGVETSTEMQ